VVSEQNPSVIVPRFALHAYQRQVLRDILGTLALPERRVVAHLPTGAGKTRIAAHAACRILNDSDTGRSLVIWLASTEELCEQAAETLAAAWASLGQREIAVHRCWGATRLDSARLDAGFLITGLAKLRSVASQDLTLLPQLAGRTSGVIFDEAHQAVAPTYSFLIEQLCSVRPPLLGLTATPGRTANLSGADYDLAEMFNRHKVSIDAQGYDSPVTYLIQNRYLANPHFIPVAFSSQIPISDPPSGADYSLGDLDRLGRDQQRISTIIGLAKDAVQRHQRTIVFCPSVGNAVTCHSHLVADGIRSYVVTGETPADDRRVAIEVFKSDDAEHMVMLNFGVLTAGFDAPRTRCVIIARPTTSLVLYSQMVGRALRGPRAGGNATAEVYTVADTNLPGFGSVADAFTNWEELWSDMRMSSAT